MGKGSELVSRISNAINADTFFGRSRGKVALRHIEAERFTLTPVKARRKLAIKRVAKPSTSGVEFTEAQMRIALAALAKGKP